MSATLLTLLDDLAVHAKHLASQAAIGSIDDIAAGAASSTGLGIKKASGVITDDLALGAQNFVGLEQDQEMKIWTKVSLGAGFNRLIIVPLFIVLELFLPVVTLGLLILGGLYLVYEGAMKLIHALQARFSPTANGADASTDTPEDKIKGAVRTDLVLTAEITAIMLGSMSGKPFIELALAMVLASILTWILIYGLILVLIRLDNAAFAMIKSPVSLFKVLGSGLLKSIPTIFKTLSVVGTAAMFLVGGEILVHTFHSVDTWWNSIYQVVNISGTKTEGYVVFGILAGFLLAGTHLGAMSVKKAI